MNEGAPQNKVLAGLPIAGAAGFLCWLSKTVWGFEIPAEQALFIVGLLTFVVQYYVRNKGVSQ